MAQQGAAYKKVDKIRQAQEARVQELRDKEAEDLRRAERIEGRLVEIDALLGLVRASREKGMDWDELTRYWLEHVLTRACASMCLLCAHHVLTMCFIRTYCVLTHLLRAYSVLTACLLCTYLLRLIVEAAKQGDPLASMVHSLDLLQHKITVLLAPAGQGWG